MTSKNKATAALTLALLGVGCAGEPTHAPVLLEGQPRAATASRSSVVRIADPALSPSDALRLASIDWTHAPVMRGLERLTQRIKTTAYVHGLDVDIKRGYYAFDCSGMVDWVLRDSAPMAYRHLRRRTGSRPLARDFVSYFAQLGSADRGWKRVARVADAQPGDVIAWLRPKFIKSENTGHVAVIVQKPRLRDPDGTAYLLRVADSSRLRHEDDSRNGHGGFGYGTILVESNPATGAPSGFSFAGSRAEHAFGTAIQIGRPL